MNVEIKVGHGGIQITLSFHHKFCLFPCFLLVVVNVCWKKPTGIFAHRYLMRCYLTVLKARGRERLTSWCGGCRILSGLVTLSEWRPAPCVLPVRVMMKRSYYAGLYEWQLHHSKHSSAALWCCLFCFYSLCVSVQVLPTHTLINTQQAVCHTSLFGCLWYQ